MVRVARAREAILKDSMTRDGLIMVVFGVLAGLFNYLYQLSMGVMLTPAEYGTLLSLASLFMIISWVPFSLQTPVAKVASLLRANQDMGAPCCDPEIAMWSSLPLP